MIKILRKILQLYLIHIKWRRYSFGKNLHAGRAVSMWARNGISIGDNFYIGKYSQIECDAVIGNDVMFANFVALVGRHDHNYTQVGVTMRNASRIRDNDYAWRGINEKVVIEDDVWVGHGAIVLSGVTICKGSIIAAGSVVTGNVESYSIYGGNPARKIRDRFDTDGEKAEHIRLCSIKDSEARIKKKS